MARIFNTSLVIKGDGKGGVKAVKQVSKSIDTLDTAQARFNKHLSRSNSLLNTYGGALGGLGMSALAADTLKASFAMDSFNTLLTSAQLEHLEAQANSLGITFEGSARSFSLLNAAAEGTVLEGSGVTDIFDALTVSARAVNLSADDMRGLFRAVEQMMNKGTVQAEELRGQLAERLPGAFSLSAKSMGVTTQELGKMLEKGEVLSTDLLPKLAVALQEKYGDKAEEMSKKGAAAVQRFRNQLFLLQADIVQGGIGEAFTDVANTSAEALKFLRGDTETLLDGLTLLASFVGVKMVAAYAASDGAIHKKIAAMRAEVALTNSNIQIQRLKNAEEVKSSAVALNTARAQLALAQSSVRNAVTANQAIIAEGRLLAARTALTAATKRASVSNTAYSAATTKATVSGKLLGGALSLVGGPAGAAVLAATGLYLLATRETELKATSEALKDAQEELNKALEIGGETAQEASEKVRAAAVSNIEAIRAEIAVLQLRAEQGLGKTFGAGTLQRIEQLYARIEAIQQSLIQNQKDLSEAKWVSDQFEEFQAQMDGLDGLIGNAKGTTEELTAEARRAAEAFQKYAEKLERAADPTIAYEAGLEKVADALNRGAISAKAAAVEGDRLKKAYEDAAGITKQREEAQDKVNKTLEEEAEILAKMQGVRDDYDQSIKDYIASQQEEILYLKEIALYGEEAADAYRNIREARKGGGEEGEINARKIEAQKKQIELNKKIKEQREEIIGVIQSQGDTAISSVVDATEYELVTKRRLTKELKKERNKQIEDLRQAHADGKISAEEMEQGMLEIHQQYADDKKEIDQDWGDAMKDIGISAVTDMVKEWLKILGSRALKEALEAIFNIGDGSFDFADIIGGFGVGGGTSGNNSVSGSLTSIATGYVKNAAGDYVKTALADSVLTGSASGSVPVTSGAGTAAASTGGTTVAAGSGSTVIVSGNATGVGGAATGNGFGGGLGTANSGAGAGASGASSALTTAAGFAVVALLIEGFKANKKKQQAKINKQLAERIGGLSGGFQTDAVTNFGQGAVGSDGSQQSYLQVGSNGFGGSYLREAIRDSGANVENGLDGVLKISGDLSAVNELSAGYTQDAVDAMNAQIDLQKEMIGYSIDREDRQAAELDIRERVRENWVESVKLANSLDFAAVAQKAGGNLAGMGSALKAMSKDGIITAKELRTHLGGAADSIIEQMSSAAGITIQELLKIIDPAHVAAKGIESAITGAALGMGSAMDGAATDMSSAIRGSVVDINSALKGIQRPKDLTFNVTENRQSTGSFGGGSFGQGFAQGGISTGPQSGHLELLHGTEAIVPLSGGRSIPVDIKGSTGADMSGVEQKLDNVISALSYISKQTHDNHVQSQESSSDAALLMSDSVEKIAVNERY